MSDIEKIARYVNDARACHRTFMRLRAADAPQLAQAAHDARAFNMSMARVFANRAAALREVTVWKF